MRREVILGSLVAFIASFCTLVIELVASRILAPYVGVSLYTWTSVIGIVLAGISVGAYLGGLLADRFPRPSTLGWLLFLSGLCALTIPFLADHFGKGAFLMDTSGAIQTSLQGRILITTTLVFFVPAMLLGMISPVVVKLTVNDLEKTGNTVGKIGAISTLGSLLGTFATGFYLIDLWGTRTLLYGVGAVLICSAPIFGGLLSGRRIGTRAAVAAASVLALVGVLGILWQYRETVARPRWLALDRATGWPAVVKLEQFDSRITYFKETDYYTIRILTEGDHDDLRKTLILDHLIHSYTKVKDPLYLKYDYLRIYEELVAWQRSLRPDADQFLFIGGGGCTLPRYFDHVYPDASIDVAEIDPGVSKVAYEQLGIQGTRIQTYNMDARWFVMNKAAITGSEARYDFIFGDVFNDLAVPYHLTTREFDEHLKRWLKPDGLLMAMVIDNVAKGQLLPAYLRTLQEVFGQDKVHLIVLQDDDLDSIGCQTSIIVAGPTRLDMTAFEAYLAKRLTWQKEMTAAAEVLAQGSAPFGFLRQPELLELYTAGEKAARRRGVTSALGILAEGTTPFGLLGAGAVMEAKHDLYMSSHLLRSASRVVPPGRLAQWMASRKERTGRTPIVLTDDHVPVDNLVAPLFEDRFGFDKGEGR